MDLPVMFDPGAVARRSRWGPVWIAVTVGACGGTEASPGETTGEAGAPTQTTELATTVGVADLSPNIPADVSLPVNATTPERMQAVYDTLSWKTFIALNWPRADTGGPDPGRTIGPDAPTVWEGWKEDYEMLVPPGQVPAPWGAPRSIPPSCGAEGASAVRFPLSLALIKKGPDVLDAFLQPGGPSTSGPLIDQNGNFARFSISVNREYFDYFITRQLYNWEAQQRGDSVRFPQGSNQTGQVGAMMVKAAWKILGPGDDPARFHTADALIHTESADSCSLQQVGLVGLHITHKTETAPAWIWATFEHIDNAPDSGGAWGSHYSFNNPACDTCSWNVAPQMPVGGWNPLVKGPPVQVVRLYPVEEPTSSVNQHFQSLLAAEDPTTPWQNYMLVGTQFPMDPGTDRRGFPPFLANTTIETYLQGHVPSVSSNCTGCHNGAMTADLQAAVFADYTFIPRRAQPPSGGAGASGGQP